VDPSLTSYWSLCSRSMQTAHWPLLQAIKRPKVSHRIGGDLTGVTDHRTESTDARLVFCVRLESDGGGGPSGTAQVGGGTVTSKTDFVQPWMDGLASHVRSFQHTYRLIRDKNFGR
jgi:hypothetical protein